MKFSLPTLKTWLGHKTIFAMICAWMAVLPATAQSRWNAISVGLSNPSGAFYQNNLTLPFDKAVGAKPGWFASFDGAFYFKESSKLSWGLSYMASYASNAVNWSTWVNGSTSFTGTSFTTAEIKLGLVATYVISNEIKVDGFARLGDNIQWGGGGKWTTSAGPSTFDTEGFGAGYGTNLGLNLRFKRLMGTFQYKTGTVKRDYFYSGPSSGGGSYKVPVTSMHVGLGFLITNQ